MVYVILADNQVDLIAYSESEKETHKRDLKKMGFKVTVKAFANAEQAEQYETKKRGW